MDNEFVIQLVRLIAAMGAGTVIGLEREYRGSEAGLRTHILVSAAAALLMLAVAFQNSWLPPGTSIDDVRLDPTRMAQGIMTGIGFLGGGVILKAGLSIRGLTTAASVWMTASIGIMFGIGMYFAAVAALGVALAALSVFPLLSRRLPTQRYVSLRVRIVEGASLTREQIGAVITNCGVSYDHHLGYSSVGAAREFDISCRTTDPENYAKLAEQLKGLIGVEDYSIEVSGS